MVDEETERAGRRSSRPRRPTEFQVRIAKLAREDKEIRRQECKRNYARIQADDVNTQNRVYLDRIEAETAQAVAATQRRRHAVTVRNDRPRLTQDYNERNRRDIQESIDSSRDEISEAFESSRNSVSELMKSSIKSFKKMLFGDYSCILCGKDVDDQLYSCCEECAV